MKNKISIVIPVYNVVKYLQDCVSSLLCQTYQNFEIILVDDGSTDGSAELCDKLRERDARIVVVHQNNSGVSSARNKGIEVSTGQFIMFMDSDDWLEKDALDGLLCKLLQSKADICFANKYFKDQNSLLIATDYVNDCSEPTSIAIQQHLKHHFISSPWLSLARNTKKVYFDCEVHIMEDWEYNFRLLASFHTFVMYDKAFYHYRTVGTSASKSPVSKRKLSCFLIPDKVRHFVHENMLPFEAEAKYVSVFLTYMMLVNYTSAGVQTKEDFDAIKKQARSILLYTLFSPFASLNNKVSILSGAISPKLFALLFTRKYGKK